MGVVVGGIARLGFAGEVAAVSIKQDDKRGGFVTLLLRTRAVWVGFFDGRVCCLDFEALDVCFLVVAFEEFEADLHRGLVWGIWLDLVGLMWSFGRPWLRLYGFFCWGFAGRIL